MNKVLKFKDLFKIDFSSKGGFKIADKIFNRYNIDKNERKDITDEIQNVANSGGGLGDNWDIINKKAYGIDFTARGEYGKNVTRIGNMEYHKTLPCHQWKGCVANAENINYYLDPNDWSKKADGTPSKLDGADGTVRVEIPTFYYKSWFYNDVNLTRRVMISPEKIDDSWYEFPNILIDAYYATLDRTNPDAPKAVSVINTNPEFRGGLYRNSEEDKFDALLTKDPRLTDLGKAITNLTLPEMSNFAKNNDSEVLCYDFYKMIVFWMPIIEYGTFNLYQDFTKELTAEGYRKGGLGKSCLNASWVSNSVYNRPSIRTPNGFTNEFGNGSGAKLLYTSGESIHNSTDPDTTNVYTVPSDLWVNRYRGIENLFGDTGYFLEGIIAGENIYNTNDPNKFTNNPADRNKSVHGFGAQNIICTDILVGDSCEMFGIETINQSNTNYVNCALVNIDNPIFSVVLQTAGVSGNNKSEAAVVFGAGGSAGGGGCGGPGLLGVDGASLALSYPDVGFRTLARINGDSKKLNYREIL